METFVKTKSQCRWADRCAAGDYGGLPECGYIDAEDYPFHICPEYRRHVLKNAKVRDRPYYPILD